jgi:hypothetical protein
MSSVEPEDPDPRHRTISLDTVDWVFEGARAGTYHVVFRESPKASPFTDMVKFLARDLAKLDEATVPQPRP